MGLGMDKHTAPAMHLARLEEIPMGFLRKGDRFVATRGNVVVTGVADMDGHMVSEDYGHRQGNDYYCTTETNYINVKLDGVRYPTDAFDRNTSMYERDDWKILVLPKAHKRYLEDKKWTPAVATRAAEKQKLQDVLIQLEEQVREVRRAISNF